MKSFLLDFFWIPVLMSAVFIVALVIFISFDPLDRYETTEDSFIAEHLVIRCDEYLNCHVYKVLPGLTCVELRPNFGANLPRVLTCVVH